MDPEQLREQVFAAVARQDAQTFLALCNQHRAAIREQFRAWLHIPAEIRDDQERVQAWVHGLMTTAQYFAATGEPNLLEALTGGADNPLTVWPRVYAEATRLADAGEYEVSTGLLRTILPELEGASGNVVDNIRPKAYGLLGSNALHLGDLEAAHDLTTKALADCKRAGDRQGAWTYTENLRSIELAREITSGDGSPSIAAQVRSRIAQAQDLSDEVWYAESNALLQDLLTAMEKMPAAVTDEYRGKVHGLLGLNAFRLGDRELAREQTALALDACRRAGDEEGVRIYTFNLDYIQQSS